MDKNYLLETANNLKQVSNSSSKEYELKAELLIAEMNKLMLNRNDLEKLVGKDNFEMMQENHSNHVRFIASILANYNSEVLVETILWVFRAYRSHGFSTNYWSAQLNAWMKILLNHLSQESYNEIFPLYEWMQINIPVFVKVSDEKLESTNTFH
ncbi:hypothetical protein SAMN05444411_110105 [Lutibacter oricola]|uniref:Uncharacterized protein n=1 Tax=Lutibacter oricola TaxID=762486 RepID=A0A1H3F5E3_9FLAO|nr:hypothetical protein [Lutibacter oricola]SDX85389.1 hypothetical protein SAMN05444411_110105 [Lutibacter oricola]